MYRFLTRSDRIDEVEKGVKDKFQWRWLEERDGNDDFFSTYIRKINQPGTAFCIWCHDTVKYGKGGKRVFKSHSKTKKHTTSRNTVKNSQPLPAVFQQVSARTHDSGLGNSCTLPYGAAPNTHSLSCSGDPQVETVSQVVNFWDRKSHSEARTVSFIAEHSLPLSIAPHLVEYAKQMAQDHKALDNISMGRTCAAYKLKDGLSEVVHKRLVKKLREVPFSMNIDECTAKNNQKILSILVSYFSEEEKATVVYPLASVSLKVVSAEVVYQAVCEVFEKGNIPFANLVSVLSDSAAYMRGKTSGFETLLRKRKAPHLLDIDGDVCHHIHNSVKQLCSHFENTVEQLCDDLHNDIKWSTDVKSWLQELCGIYSCIFHTPKERIPHRWLSVLDVSSDIINMLPAILCMYFSYVPNNLRHLYKDLVALSHLPESCKSRIAAIRKLCERKFQASTKAGKARKIRIMKKLFDEHYKTMSYLYLYNDILPMFKSCVLLFQQSSPMIHRIHDEITDLVRTFLAGFIKHEKVKDVPLKELKSISLTEFILPSCDIYTGARARKCISKLPQLLAEQLMLKLKTAYLSTGEYLLKKMPIDNRLLHRLSSIDPKAMGYSVTFSVLKKLPRHFPNILQDDEQAKYEQEVSCIQLDKNLPQAVINGETVALDEWWAEVLLKDKCKYPILSKVIRCALSIFTAPKIEQSFSVMNNLINCKTNRLDVSMYHAYQTVKYDLKAKSTTTLDMYKRPNILKSPVDRSLCYHIQTASWRKKVNTSKATISKEQNPPVASSAVEKIPQPRARKRVAATMEIPPAGPSPKKKKQGSTAAISVVDASGAACMRAGMQKKPVKFSMHYRAKAIRKAMCEKRSKGKRLVKK